MTGPAVHADAASEATAIEHALRAGGSLERAVSEKAYLKSDLEFAGISVPVLRSTARTWCADRPDLTRADLVAVARALWSRAIHDCRMAVELLDANASLLRAEDTHLVETMLRTARTWALVDNLCAIRPGGARLVARVVCPARTPRLRRHDARGGQAAAAGYPGEADGRLPA